MLISLQLIFLLIGIIALRGSFSSLFRGVEFEQNVEVKKYQSIDNIYRFMAGAYFGTGIICLWMAITMHEQGFLVYLMALVVFSAAMGRVISIRMTDASDSKFYRYIIAEVGIAIGILVLQYARMN